MKPVFKRVFHWATKEISRNKGVFLTTLFILTVGTTILGTLFLLRGVTDYAVNLLENKADITVFFNKDTKEEEILKFQDELSKIPEVKEVKYISKEQAMASFKEKHKSEPDILKSLEEIGENPFLPHLNIKASNASQYEKIAHFIQMSPVKEEVNKIDYYQNKTLINRIFSLSKNIKLIYTILILTSLILIILVVFNTVRLAIYDLREEISIMRLVGASNWFIRGPFIVEGFIIGLIGAFISLVFTGVISYFFAPKVAFFIPGFDLLSYFRENLLLITGGEFVFAIGVAVVSSLIAVRKYLKI